MEKDRNHFPTGRSNANGQEILNKSNSNLNNQNPKLDNPNLILNNLNLNLTNPNANFDPNFNASLNNLINYATNSEMSNPPDIRENAPQNQMVEYQNLLTLFQNSMDFGDTAGSLASQLEMLRAMAVNFKPWDAKVLMGHLNKLVKMIDDSFGILETGFSKFEESTSPEDSGLDIASRASLAANLESAFEFIRHLMLELYKMGYQADFSRLFCNWLEQICQDHPEKKDEIRDIFLEEIENIQQYIIQVGYAFKSIENLGYQDFELAIRQILLAYQQMADKVYYPYIQFLYRIYLVCGLTDEIDRVEFGAYTRRTNELFRRHYPAYRTLVDDQVVKIRNASVHNCLDFDEEHKTVRIYNVNPKGDVTYSKLCSFDEVAEIFEKMKSLLWIEDGGLLKAYQAAAVQFILPVFEADYQNFRAQLPDPGNGLNYLIKPMDEATARSIVKWQYPEPYAMYSMSDDLESIAELMDGSYYAVREKNGELIGFYCFGAAARVPAGDVFGVYRENLLDIGLGMRPDLCGQGKGYEFFLTELEFAQEEFNATRFRLTVLASNQRAIKLYEKVGFLQTGKFERETDRGTSRFITMRLCLD